MIFSIITLFPGMFVSPISESIIKKAINKKLVKFNIYNLRDWATDKYKSVDDKPYGGGHGMILRIDIIDKAVQSVLETERKIKKADTRIILLDPKGTRFNEKIAQELSQYEHLLLISGHYEGVDARVYDFVDETISIGDYILTGGELPAMVISDAITRLIPGVLKNHVSHEDESFSINLLEYPQYTKPRVYKNKAVPKILFSGNHEDIKSWRLKHSQITTKKLRPDLLSG